MKLKVISNEKSSTPEFNDHKLYESIKSRINFCYLVSGYRGVGKTYYIKKLIDNIKKEEELEETKEHSLFIYQNIDKYEGYPILIRKLIRDIFLQIEGNKKVKEHLRKNDKLLLDKIENLYKHTFFEINESYLQKEANERTRHIRSYFKIQNLSDTIFPIITFVISTSGLNFDILANNVSYVMMLFSIIWLVLTSINFEMLFSKSYTNQYELELKTLYDDEIAEFHLNSILEEMKKKEIHIYFIFDEVDKIDDSIQLKSIFSDLKHLLLMETSSSIVISGQPLFYEYLQAEVEDDALLSNIFSENFHIPLRSIKTAKKELEERFKLPNTEEEIIDPFFDSLLLKSKKVVRNIENSINNDIFWENGERYLQIDESRSEEYRTDAKILSVINEIEQNNIKGKGVDRGVEDLLVYQLFILIQKIKLMGNEFFELVDLFSDDMHKEKKYPYWISNQIEMVALTLLEKMKEKDLLEIEEREGVNYYRWEEKVNLSIMNDSEIIYQFIESYIKLEKMLRQINEDVLSVQREFQPMQSVINNLTKLSIIDENKAEELKKLSKIRNQVIHGQTVDVEEKNYRSYINKIKNTQAMVIEDYSLYIIRKYYDNNDGEIVIRNNPGESSIASFDAILQYKNEVDIYIDIKINNNSNTVLKSKISHFKESFPDNSKLIIIVYDFYNSLERVEKYYNSLNLPNNVFIIFMEQFNQDILISKMKNITSEIIR